MENLETLTRHEYTIRVALLIAIIGTIILIYNFHKDVDYKTLLEKFKTLLLTAFCFGGLFIAAYISLLDIAHFFVMVCIFLILYFLGNSTKEKRK